MLTVDEKGRSILNSQRIITQLCFPQLYGVFIVFQQNQNNELKNVNFQFSTLLFWLILTALISVIFKCSRQLFLARKALIKPVSYILIR